eukprot:CAMPEP_0119300366 /NCGR_PEP_ID=MMETSP1333-20130426/2320_1 /TAXON_ID=418940 /ORGANISM="Scyphosphaera apsteinii, Strain RCC1455" /LENGTH=77 /DNA_ID=CAMNT_0007302109 /DNA_START=128 /DNA_END=361 /DNA_ORIENTATION=+
MPRNETPLASPSRSQEEQAEIEAELEALHRELGVKPGAALKEALKPDLVCPMPEVKLAVFPVEVTDASRVPASTKPR